MKQGLWGIFEVFVSTMVICTLSALLLLSSDVWNSGFIAGASAFVSVFEKGIPHFGKSIFCAVSVFFALSSILGWAYYGEVAVGFLARDGKIAVFLYRLLFLAVIFFGAVAQIDFVWGVSETLNGLMAIPNLIAVAALSGVAVRLSREYFSNPLVTTKKTRYNQVRLKK